MIRPLPTLFQYRQSTIQMSRSFQQGFYQRLAREQLRAGAGYQQPVAFQNLHRHFVDPPVSQCALLEILAPLDERRWIHDHHVEMFTGFTQRLQHLEGIALTGLHLISDPIQRRVGRGLRQRRSGGCLLYTSRCV